MHDSCVVVSLLKAIPIVLTVKILVICKLAKGLAPWASVWCGGEWANAYPVIALGGGSYPLCSCRSAAVSSDQKEAKLVKCDRKVEIFSGAARQGRRPLRASVPSEKMGTFQ
jgi:hypothetical protein